MVWRRGLTTPPLFMIDSMDKNAAKIVNSAILGMDFKNCIVNGKTYTIYPPTIRKLAGAGYYLSDLTDCGESVKDAIASLKDLNNLAYALSFMINGDDNLFEELSQGTFDEVVDALCECYSLVSVENFIRLSALSRNVTSLTAKQRP